MTSSWMIFACACYAMVAVCIKLSAGRFSAAELMFYRSVIPCLVLGGWALASRRSLRTPFARGHVLRGLTGCISLAGYIYAILHLPLATAITLNYTSPIFLTIFSTLLLGERFANLLIAAIATGFCGVLLLLQPSVTSGDSLPAVIGLISGVAAGLAHMNVRLLGKAGEPEWRVVFYFTAVCSLVSALWQGAQPGFAALAVPDRTGLLLIAGMGFAALAGQLAMTRAYATGNTLTASALAYLTIVFSSLSALVIWQEQMVPLAWLGIALIILSGLAAIGHDRRKASRDALILSE